MNERLGVAAALLSSTLGGLAAVATRFVVGTVDPVTIAAFRRRLCALAPDRARVTQPLAAAPGLDRSGAARADVLCIVLHLYGPDRSSLGRARSDS